VLLMEERHLLLIGIAGFSFVIIENGAALE
jgi:hypothetical protein